ncbi:AraC family transcriptional regulator [Cellvibrio japonicus]|uniref:Transcriptional regulator, AraC family n=1 Tax=Cellvibrio japonicus (strain Ueda107) TaxID=498211 RepID=B3PKT3_CELJU|nr:AraC family transcriptional regulator ligand-binding domain-containing protein [Cellvibrio japonicus]ACE84925.1 transcriptional regulator, AraC family [Cellvibrio japonicus Ueda107]QEI11495.1 helix-turn-helix domain-containing protein [Cellvibrio japonicus]QEI15069.1 helix-turn-helix domain-containing protein [Cellvibrio japonicus]QEI18649.1 helix-turn-helix domain-containing protein [Cellvibrio japonicus]
MARPRAPSTTAYYQCDTPLVPLQQWPSLLIELALARNLPEYRLLRGTGIFIDDVMSERLLTPIQVFQLIHNSQRQRGYEQCGYEELRFLLGNHIFPGHYGAASNALVNAAHLYEWLATLVRLQRLLFPLLQLRLELGPERVYLYWRDSTGAHEACDFLSDMLLSGIHSCVRWLSGKAFDWQLQLRRLRPAYYEQYELHWGEQVQFGSLWNRLSLARSQAFSPWPHASTKAFTSAEREAQQQLAQLPEQQSFLAALYRYLEYHLLQPEAAVPNLESTAAAFCMSSASLKRKLQKHHTHFQAIYDELRRALALEWLGNQSLPLEQLAQRLHFHDSANLRRALKKWTGLTPQALRLESEQTPTQRGSIFCSSDS